MGRHAEYSDEDLKKKLQNIATQYGTVSIESLKKAQLENPKEYPSYKMFERRFGGIKTIKKMLNETPQTQAAQVSETKETKNETPA